MEVVRHDGSRGTNERSESDFVLCPAGDAVVDEIGTGYDVSERRACSKLHYDAVVSGNRRRQGDRRGTAFCEDERSGLRD